MPSDESERLLLRLGETLAEDVAYPLDGTLLYARVSEDIVAPSIFKNRGNNILYRSPDLNLISSVLLNLWRKKMRISAGRRWNI